MGPEPDQLLTIKNKTNVDQKKTPQHSSQQLQLDCLDKVITLHLLEKLCKCFLHCEWKQL